MKDRSQINGTARLRFQGPPPTRLRISYEVVGAKRNEDQAQLQTRHVVQYGGGFATYGCRWRLHKTPDGWKVFQHRE
jgi:hypothetical protein